MEFIDTMPVWALALLIFILRIIDVSMGTVRTLGVVEGLAKLSVVLGFFEVLIWIVAVSQVVTRLTESPILPIAYASGFAAGNAIGILIEKRLAFGLAVMRIISVNSSSEIASTLRDKGHILTTFTGEGRDGPVVMIYISCPRKKIPEILVTAREIDPDLFFVIERINECNRGQRGMFHQTGWPLIVKKK